VVFVDHRETAPAEPAVLTPSVAVRPGQTPVIETITAESGEPAVNTSVLLLRGERLRATEGETRVRLTGDASETTVSGVGAPAGAHVTDDAVRLPLSTHTDLRAGIQGVQVIHYLRLSLASVTLYPVFASDVAAFVLHPRVTAAALAAGPAINVTLAPPARAGQPVQAELIDANGAIVYVAHGTPPTAETAAFTFPLPGAPAGMCRVRVRVDGAESPLPGAPQVTLP
jgi:hypothetical protein